jgi:hypothetical protein
MADLQEKERKTKFNQQNLHREEIFSDLTVGSIRQLSPVKQNGEPDKTRPILFVGESHAGGVPADRSGRPGYRGKQHHSQVMQRQDRKCPDGRLKIFQRRY